MNKVIIGTVIVGVLIVVGTIGAFIAFAGEDNNIDDEEDTINTEDSSNETNNNDDEENDNEEITDVAYEIELVNSTGITTNANTSEIVEQTNNEATIEGVIIGNTGGQQPIVENVNVDGEEVTVTVGLEKSDGFVTQVITAYEYSLQLEDIPEDADINVKHNSTADFSSEAEEVEYEFSQGGDGSGLASVTEKTEDSLVIEGSFVTGSSSCTEAGLDSVTVVDNELHVDLHPQSVGDMEVCTDDISHSSYTLKVDNIENIEEVHVNASQSHYDDVKTIINL